MAWSRYQICLVMTLIVTGSINTLSTKWADKLSAKGSDGSSRLFNHPFLQALAMFLGETVCLFVFKFLDWFSERRNIPPALTQGNQNFNKFILLPAAMFDLIGTSIMYIGLTLTYASSFQMFRGSIIVFVAILSMTFLGRIIKKQEWLGIASIIMGLAIVGVTDSFYRSDDSKGRNSMITGDLLIIIAQVISACQMVYEEKFVSGLNIPPLLAVGLEGIFGFTVLAFLSFIFYWTPAPPYFGNNPRGTIEDVVDGLIQIGNNGLLLLSIIGTIISIAFFNFAGISVTKEMSATTRMVLDSVRIFVIWMFSLAVQWQSFHWQHLIGFAILILGTCLYNRIIPCLHREQHEVAVQPYGSLDESLSSDDDENTETPQA